MTKRVSMCLTTAVCALACVLAAGTSTWAQPVMTTVVGKGETIAVAYDPNSGTVYYAADRPGAIYGQTSPYGGVLVAGMPGGSLANGIPANQAAIFPGRNGLAVDAGGNIFFSEPALRRIRRIDAQTGIVTTVAGTATGGPAPTDSNFFQSNNAIFSALAAPGALAFNPVTGDLFVADETWDIVYRITGNGSPITSSNGFIYRAVGGNPDNSSIYLDGQWYNPYGYAGDNGPAIDAKLNHPRGLAFDGFGNLFIADSGNNVVRYVDASTNVITTIVGNGVPGFAGDGGPGASAELFMPTGVGVLEDRTLYIADTSNHRVRQYSLFSHQIFTFGGNGVAQFADNSYAYPTGIGIGPDPRFFVVDSQNRSISESDLSSDSGPLNVEIAHIGDPTDPGYTGDGATGGDAVNQPMAVVFDKNGNAFFSDSGNSRVRRVDAATHAVTTVVGNGIPGYDGDNGDALHARLNCPAGLAFGASGDLFVGDTCANVVRHVSPGADGLITGEADELITTYAGTGVRYGYADNWGGQATAARLNAPATIAFSAGTLFVGEPNIATIARIAPTGAIDYGLSDIEAHAFTVDRQGNFVLADAADARDLQCNGQEILFLGTSIKLWGGVAVDASGRLYATANSPNQIVYRFQASGGGSFCSATSGVDQLSLAGAGAIGYSGDNGPATAATLNQPAGLADDASNNVWIADMGNNAIRRIEQPSVGVKASPARLDFGTQALQTMSASQTATATSSGTAPATFSAATLSGANPGDFIIVSDGCAGTVAASGAKCQVSVAFKPTASGPRSAVLQFNDNAADTPQSVILNGGAATLDVSPSAIAFTPQTELIASSPLQVTVTNRGASAVSIVSLSFTGQNPGDFSIVTDGCTNASLSGGGSCTFGVVFTPQDLGSRIATLTVTSSATDLLRLVNVTGTGTPTVPSAAIAPPSVAFPQTTIGSRSTAATITVTSNGTAPLMIASTALTGNQPQDFTLTGDSCSGATLTPSQTCTVSVAFAPIEVCNATAAVTFTDNAPDSPQNVALNGHGVSAGGPFQAVIYCTSHAAQPQELAAGPDGNVWFDERGSVFAPGAIGKANATSGVISEDLSVVQNQWHPSALSIASDGSYAYLESRGGGFGQWYDIVNPQGDKIQQPIGFPGPSGVGPDNGFWLEWRVTCADGFLFQHFVPNGATVSVVPDPVWLYYNTFGKACLAPSFAATGPDGLEWIGTYNGGPDVGTGAPNGFVRVTLDNVIADFTRTDAPPVAATVGPDGNMWALMASLGGGLCSLEQIAPGVPGRSVTLDPSLAGLGCFSIAPGPDHRLWMTATTTTINAKGTAFVQAIVAFNPVNSQWSVYPTTALNTASVYLAAGPDEGIWFDAIPSAVARLDIGGGPSKAYVTPTTIGFPSTIINLPAGSRYVVVRSSGTASLTITSVALAGADKDQFLIQNNGCLGAVLPPGQTCTIQLTSLPTKRGDHVAQLVITDNDAFSPQVVRLAEFTLPPGPTISPVSPSFPNAIVGTHGTTVTFTLTNPYDRSLTASASLSGANYGDFTMLNNTCQNGPVAAGGTCTVDIRFDPTAAGKRQAVLSFSDNATPPTQSVTLAATGQATTGGGGGGPSCACNSTGNFVDPKVVYPAVSNPFAASSTSPSGAYSLDIRSDSSTGKPTAFVITKKGASTPFATIDAPNPSGTVWASQYPWGFSPDDDRFVLHYATFGSNGATTTDWEDTIVLYDLKSSTPTVPVSGSTLAPLPIAPDGGIATGPSGSVAFSRHGAYLVAAQLQSTAEGPWIVLTVLTSGGAKVYQHGWNPSSAPADPEDEAGSAFWGFSPDEQSFAYYLQEPGDQNYVELINLPTGTVVHEIHDSATKDLKVQFAPCGEVIAVEYTDATAPVDAAETNPVHVALYSTQPGSGPAALFDEPGLPTNETIVVTAGTGDYYVTVNDGPEIDLVPNPNTGSCPSPSTTGDAGGSDAPAKAQAASFKNDFTSDPPAAIATLGQEYSYTFEADGSPDPTFGFFENTCTFLSIDGSTGEVSGMPTQPFTTCKYVVRADNLAGAPADSPEFTITMTPVSPPSGGGGGSGGSGGGPSPEDDSEPAIAAVAVAPAPSETTSTAPSQQTTLVLPRGRGQIVLNADVTPSVSTFTYTEIDLSRSTGKLLFAGLDFSLTAVNAASGAAATSFVDPPLARLVFLPSDLQSARIGDPTTLSVYWWNGTAWINQMPCAGCGVDSATNTLTVLLSQPGEYMLAAAQPAETITLTGIPVSAAVGTPFSGPVARFAPLYPTDLVGFYSASVTWGDGQTSDGPISLSGGTFIISSSHTWAAAGTYTVSVAVSRGESGGTTQTAARVSGPGVPPAFTAANPPLSATVGTPYVYTFTASGAPAATFALGAGAPSWLTINASTGAVTGTPPPGPTSFSYNVIASNGVTPNATAGPFTVTVNAPPAFTAANPPLTATVGTVYSYAFAASGVPAPTFALGSGTPSWLSINASTGAVSGTPPTGTTSFTYSVIASNGVTPNATVGPFSVAVSTATNKSADLSLAMTVPAQVTKGSTITYSIVVTNNGTSTATNIGLLLLAGPDLSVVSMSPAPQLNLDGLWTWRLAALAPGQSATFTLRAKAVKTEILLAAAAVGADTPDPKPANNVAAAVTVVK